MGSSNPCLTILLVYSATTTIALIITGALLGTHTSGIVTCTGETSGVQVTHYSILDESQDTVEGDESEEPVAKCHCNHTCNCRTEQLITGVEIFLLTSASILILALTIFTCVSIRTIILKRKKLVKQKKAAEIERVKRDNELQEIEKRREWVRDAIELGALPAQKPRNVPKDLE